MMYYNENTIAWFNGAFIPAAEAKGSLYDQTLHYGYGAFEGIRAYQTESGVKIFKATAHFHRLQASCEAVHIPYPFHNEELIEISYELLSSNGFGDAYIRPLVISAPNMSLTKSSHSNLFICAWEWPAYFSNQLLKLTTSSYRRISPLSFPVEAKVSGYYVNSILATQQAKDNGFDEALMLDINGYVAEASGANIFIESNGVLFTPAKGSILPGITRATVIEICRSLDIKVVEKKITPDELYEADAVFLCGTAAEVKGVGSIDNKTFKKQWENSLGAVIQKAYKNLVLDKEYRSLLDVA